MKLYGFLFVLSLSLLLAGCATGSAYTFKGAGSCTTGACATDQSTVSGSVGGLGEPQQVVYMSGSGCTPPPPVATPIYVPPAAPAMTPKMFCTDSTARSCQIAYVQNIVATPVCNVQSITTSGGTPATTWATIGGVFATLIYAMVSGA